MTPERWELVHRIYQSALEQEPSRRADFLKEACIGDEEMPREVESILAHEKQSLIGRQIGSYKILSLLGVGGMGEVYLASDTRLDRKITLKILPAQVASDSDRIRRFIREAKAASALNHPNVATIHEIGEFKGVSFIAMEYVEGQTLAAKISGHPLEIVEITDIGLQRRCTG
jgi:eukaryotic-like serine/threonine-protein kinase